ISRRRLASPLAPLSVWSEPVSSIGTVGNSRAPRAKTPATTSSEPAPSAIPSSQTGSDTTSSTSAGSRRRVINRPSAAGMTGGITPAWCGLRRFPPMLAVSLRTAYTLSLALGSLLAMGVAAAVFLPRLVPVCFVKEFLRTDWKYLGVAWIVTNLVNTIAHRFHADRTFTWLVYEFEGPIVAAFQSVTSEPLTLLFTAAYLVGFPTIVLFTYFKLKAHDEREARRYALAYVVLVLIAVPFFVFVPVGIPALYPAVAVKPLIFDVSPIIR